MFGEPTLKAVESTHLAPINSNLNLRSLSGKPILVDADPSRPGLLCIYEWSDYVIEWANSDGKSGQIGLQGQLPSTYRFLQGATTFSFQNQLGRTRLEIVTGSNDALLVELEVLSPKFPTM